MESSMQQYEEEMESRFPGCSENFTCVARYLYKQLICSSIITEWFNTVKELSDVILNIEEVFGVLQKNVTILERDNKMNRKQLTKMLVK